MTDGVVSTTGVDLQMASKKEIKNLIHAGARRPGTPGKSLPEHIRFERRIGSMAVVPGRVLETGVMLDSSAGRSGRCKENPARLGQL